MEVINQVYPTEPGQVEKMMEPGPDGPIVMVNLLKFKPKAVYKDGRQSALTGRAAYDLYGKAVTQYIQNFGGRVLFGGDVTHLTLGVVDELWDEVALAEYPNRAAMVAMSRSEDFKTMSEHREAGLAGQLNIETVYNLSMQNPLAPNSAT
tara:strand:+ start:35 stop:484 length:450 start_codon:yes stop_codon:yes gene_type:complete